MVGALVAVTVDPPAPAVDLTGADQAMPIVAVAAPTTTASGPPSTSAAPPATGASGPATTVAPAATTAPATTAPLAPAVPARVLVVGDSQAWVLGNALVRWGDARDDAVVWNRAVRGCGIVRGGEAVRLGEVTQGACEDWAERWGSALEDFAPDVVVVLSGSWDLIDRRLPSWDGFRSYGDPVFDAHVVEEYRAAAELLAAGGPGRRPPAVVWLTTPCHELEAFGQDPRHLDRDLLPAALAPVRGVEVVDLFAKVCPADRFTQELGGLTGVRPDGLHLSDVAADWVADWLGPQLLDAAGAVAP